MIKFAPPDLRLCARCGLARCRHRVRSPAFPDILPPGAWCPNRPAQEFVASLEYAGTPPHPAGPAAPLGYW